MKIYARSISSQLGDMAIDNVAEVDKIAVLKSRYAATREFEVKFKKLNLALLGLALAERPLQLKRLQQAKVYVDALKKEAPQGFGSQLDKVSNEITSLREGIFAGLAQPTDLVLLSGAETLAKVEGLRQKLATRIQAADTPEQILDPDQKLIVKTQKAKEKMIALGNKPFVVTRAPVAFSVERSKGSSAVGYLDPAKLNGLGFNAELLDRYAVLHNQLVIGVGKEALNTAPKIVKKIVKFKNGEVTNNTTKKSASTLLEVATSLKTQIEQQSHVKWAFVSDHVATFSDGQALGRWYWIMPVADIARLASAFPGGHLKLQSWGFAF